MTGNLINLPSRETSLFVREVGHGYPILFMHGGPGADQSTMSSLLPLAKDFRLIFYDHRCNGRSMRNDLETMEWGNLTADAEAIRHHLQIENWAVCGHSFGGMVALEYAIRYQENLKNLILLDTSGDIAWVQKNASVELKNRGFSKLVVATAEKFYSGQIAPNELNKTMFILGRAYYSHPGIVLIIKEAIHGLKIRANSEACIYGFKDLLPGWSVMNRLKHIKAHTLIIAGSDDFKFPPSHQKELENGIVGAELHLLSDAGHNAPIEQSRKVVELISQFLKRGKCPTSRCS